MKKQVEPLSAIPSKRVFLAIIADYDLNRSVCELIDNALDIWVKNKKKAPLNITIELEKDQQIIRICDDAGGVKQSDLSNIVAPGQTSNTKTDEIIGIFGVGTKRAVVALAQDIKITTCYGKSGTFQIEFDEKWLGTDNWNIDVCEVDDISVGTTIIELKKLRIKLTEENISNLKDHLEATYGKFLEDQNIIIKINSEMPLCTKKFDQWAYPPNYPPHRFTGDLHTDEGKDVKVEIIAGLTTKSSPALGEYGVYFYCNNRLIARGLKTYDVGFTKGLAGFPHASISLARIIISLNGEAGSMPWNSSKSGLNPNHPVFIALRDFIIQTVKDYTSLSRRWVSKWSEEVFNYPSGNIVDKTINNFPKAKKSYLPPLPVTKPRYQNIVIQSNKYVSDKKPWTKGLYEAIIAVDTISKKDLEQKNRINLIILDSTLEIAFKEFLINESGKHYTDRDLLNLFEKRHLVHQEIKNFIKLPKYVWQKIIYYYNKRCDLIHKRATAGITDYEIEDFRKIVQKVLKKLFDLNFNQEK